MSGTTASDEFGQTVSIDDAYGQTEFILRKIESALKEAGAELTDVVRTRLFVTDIDRWEEIGKAHGEFFSTVRPATTMVEVSRLINPESSGRDRSGRRACLSIEAMNQFGQFNYWSIHCFNELSLSNMADAGKSVF